MTSAPDDRRRWWYAAGQWAHGERPRLKLLRDVALVPPQSALWPLLKAELMAMSPSDGEHGRLALTVLLDLVQRLKPEAYPSLCDALVDCVVDGAELAEIGRLWRSARAAFEGIAHDELAPIALDVPQNETERRTQAEALLAYTRGTSDYNTRVLGLAAAATWAGSTRRDKLMQVSGLSTRTLFADTLALACTMALRARRLLARSGRGWLPPDPTAWDATPSAIFAAAPPSVAALKAQLPPTASEPEPTKLRLGGIAQSVSASSLWPLVERALQQLPQPRALRVPQLAELAIVALLEEVAHARPDLVPKVLAHLEDAKRVLRQEHVGDFWSLLEPVFHSWAKRFEPELERRESVAIGRLLRNQGDILPWDDALPSSEKKREALIEVLLHKVYVKDSKDLEERRRAAYWGATWARNEAKHNLAATLEKIVVPTKLLPEVVALAALAALRFRARLALIADTTPSVPDLTALVKRLSS